MKISDFFNEQVRDANLYTNYRTIPGMDMLKNTQRKCLWVMQNSKGEDKISNKASAISQKTEYLHGNASLETVLSGLNVSYNGSGNNLPVLKGKGQFGSKFNPEAIGASRYVYTSKAPVFDYVYRQEDICIYKDVYFEGTKIEPPVLFPVIIPICNLVYSIGNGFAAYILPRNPKNIIEYVETYLKTGKENKDLLIPYLNGFSGTVTSEGNIHTFIGAYEKVNTYTIKVTEPKPFIGLEGYLSHLDKLVKDKVIKSYKDESMSDKFDFTLSVAGDFWDKYDTAEKVQKVLNLVETATENITIYSEDGRIVQYDNIEAYIADFIPWRLNKYNERKEYYLSQLSNEVSKLSEKLRFIKSVVDGSFVVNNKTKNELVSYFETNYTKFADYSYLLNIPVYSFTKDEYIKLQKLIDTKNLELENLKQKSPSDIWLEDILELKEFLK